MSALDFKPPVLYAVPAAASAEARPLRENGGAGDGESLRGRSVVLVAPGSQEIILGTVGYDAILDCVKRCENLGLPQPIRVYTDDWVTIGEIAARADRSRETVRLWSLGRAGPGGFPPPLNPGSETLFYSWAEIVPWLRLAGRNIPRVEPVLPAMNLALQLRHLLPNLAALGLYWTAFFDGSDYGTPVRRSRHR